MPTFKIGDTVTYVGEKGRLLGETGIVKDLYMSSSNKPMLRMVLDEPSVVSRIAETGRTYTIEIHSHPDNFTNTKDFKPTWEV
jgi:hypothetical protein